LIINGCLIYVQFYGLRVLRHRNANGGRARLPD
jgi:hypothetical protein